MQTSGCLPEWEAGVSPEGSGEDRWAGATESWRGWARPQGHRLNRQGKQSTGYRCGPRRREAGDRLRPTAVWPAVHGGPRPSYGPHHSCSPTSGLTSVLHLGTRVHRPGQRQLCAALPLRSGMRPAPIRLYSLH